MKTTRIMALASLAVLCATGALAQSSASSGNGFYAELGYSPVEVFGAGGDAKPTGARLVVGYELNKNMGLEAMYTGNTTKDGRVGYDASFTGFGLMLKPKAALSEDTEVFARVGAMRADITASSSGTSSDTDFAYGLGVQTNFNKSVYGQLDYMRSYDRNSISAKGYTLSLGIRF